LHFEASIATASAGCVLVRGVAWPLAEEQQVKMMLSRREVLNSSATAQFCLCIVSKSIDFAAF
jgi:hypothetical protein